jgi:hypothetical protein
MPVLGQAPAPQPAEGQLIAPPSWAYNDLACGPVSDVSKPVKKGDKQSKQAGAPVIPDLRIIGTQDTVTRQLLGPGDTLVVSGGSNAGLEPGQRYFVRRRIREQVSTDNEKAVPDNIHTSGWVQILGVDTMLATATVVHACDGIMLDDFLVPFTPPMIAASPSTGTTPQYENMGRIISGYDGTRIAGSGNLVTIDRGSSSGVALGQRFLIFRDKREERVDLNDRSKVFAEMAQRAPLVQIGEVLVVAVREDDATVKIVVSKDAVSTGDLVVPVR